MWRDGERQVYHQVSLADLSAVAKEFLKQAGHCPVWLFSGDMGSGKTTLIKAICANLGVKDAMSSPTFSIVNEYLTGDRKTVYHFDFYRIKNEREALDIGTEDYFYSGNFCFVEWPEKIPSLIPPTRAEIHLTSENQHHRTLALSVHDGEEKNRV